MTADVRMAQYETGTRVPKEKVLFYIAKALDVSLEYLIAPSIVSSTDFIITLMEQHIDHLNEVKFDEKEYIFIGI